MNVSTVRVAGARAMLARLDGACAFGCAEAEELRRWIDHGGDPAEARLMLAEMGEDPDAPLPLDNPERNGWLLRTALGMSALTPHFLFR